MPGSYDYPLPMTAGASRSIQQAIDLASQQLLRHAGLQHLLVGLLSEESEAQELLHGFQVTRDSVLESFLFGPTTSDSSSESTVDEIADAIAADLKSLSYGEPSEAEPPKLDSDLEHVIARAKGIASRRKVGEVATDHLLMALIEVPSAVASYLKEAGVTLDDQKRASADGLVAPMDVEIDIEWNASEPMGDANVFRILDASANRAREGLRVVEDYCRFVWDDAFLCERLKSVRHDLAAVLKELAVESWVVYRDTPQDVGTQISTPAERDRQTGLDVVAASLKRIEEAFRSLEEYSKLVKITATSASDASVSNHGARDDNTTSPSAQIEQLRYRIYTIEKAIMARARSRHELENRSLYLLLTQAACRLEVDAVLNGAISGGVRVVQIREKEMTDRALLTFARHVRKITRAHDVLLIMNDRPDLAVLCEADGVHVGQDELSVRACRRIVGAKMLIGVSTHTIEQARQAVLDGANYIGVGPVFPSKTKSFDSFAGLDFVRQVASEISLPAFPIGGLDSDNLQQVLEAGAKHAAVSNCICGSQNPEIDARRLIELFSNAGLVF
jgi:thiamine-phosphate pyrophosphorylase